MFGWHGNVPCDCHSAVTCSCLHGHIPGFHGAHAGPGKNYKWSGIAFRTLPTCVLLCSHHQVCLAQGSSIPVLATHCSAQFEHFSLLKHLIQGTWSAGACLLGNKGNVKLYTCLQEGLRRESLSFCFLHSYKYGQRSKKIKILEHNLNGHLKKSSLTTLS